MRDLALSSNICLSRDGQILGQTVGEHSDRKVTTQQFSNKNAVYHQITATIHPSLTPERESNHQQATTLSILYRYYVKM